MTGGEAGGTSLETAKLFLDEARALHTATVLADGRILVVGGRNASGAIASIEALAEGAWSAVTGMTDPRWGHTATLLKDGRVLIAGGANAAGAVSSLELFDPQTGAVAVAATMAAAREEHAATLLSDGRVLIAGGANADGVLASTEIFDPETMSLSSGPSMASARHGLTLTTLIDGRVAFIGGHDGTQNLGSAEIYSTVSNAITPATVSPMVARRGHVAILLPNNNAVLIAGGIAQELINGEIVEQETTAAELYLPWLNEVWQTGAMTAPRAQAVGSALSVETYGAQPESEGLALVAGGAGGGSDAYRFATIRVDKNDYYPGDQVFASGTGWLPNETVTLALRELRPSTRAGRSR